MSIGAFGEYIRAVKERYRKSNKKEKTVILNELCAVTGRARNYAIRVLSGSTKLKGTRAGAKAKFDRLGLKPWVRQLYFAMEQPGPLKMVAALPYWLPHFSGIGFTAELREQLLKISPSSLERILKLIRQEAAPYGLSTTRRGTLLKSRIPIQTVNWNITKPGFFEVDTVAHCGNSLAGEFANSLTMTDIHSTWTENRAVFTKGTAGIIDAVRDIEALLPFSILGIDSDNGSEFLNFAFLEFVEKRPQPIQFSRCRPYHKNDQCFVEQKNFTHVRLLFGYDRVEKRWIAPLMNEIYKNYWNPLQNFFLPTTKLIRKTRIGAKIKKKYEKPKTAYQRLLDSADIPEETKQKLQARYRELNPFDLKLGLEKKLKHFFEELRKANFRVVA